MYHCCVIYSWKIAIDEIKFIQAKQSRPNSLNLNISKVFSNAAMTAWKGSHEKQLEYLVITSPLTTSLL